MKSYKAAISLITRKRLFSETIQSLFSHSPFKGQCRLPLRRRLSCFTSNQCVVQVREQKITWHSNESLRKKSTFRAKLPEEQAGQNPAKLSLGSDLFQNTLL